MRRQDRAVTDAQTMLEMLSATNVCHVAFHAEPYPYVVPLHHGVCADGENVCLYMHCAHDGRKLSLMRQNPHVSFAVSMTHRIDGNDEACSYSTSYESVLGVGELCIVTDDAEKERGMASIMRGVAPEKAFAFTKAALESVTILRLQVASMTAKKRPMTP